MVRFELLHSIYMKRKEIEHIAFIIVLIGAFNWGLLGAFKIDFIATLLSSYPVLVQGIYILIGLSGLYTLYKRLHIK
jgi:uncharacterized protein